MSPRHRGRGVLPLETFACVLALGLGACSAKSAGKDSAAPPVTAPAAGGDAAWPGIESAQDDKAEPALAGDDVEAMHARVDAAWVELQGLDDARKKEATAAGAPRPGDAVGRCERIRGLANEICTLRDRMCTLATEHPGQARYADACARSGQTCAQAREAAERCPAA